MMQTPPQQTRFSTRRYGVGNNMNRGVRRTSNLGRSNFVPRNTSVRTPSILQQYPTLIPIIRHGYFNILQNPFEIARWIMLQQNLSNNPVAISLPILQNYIFRIQNITQHLQQSQKSPIPTHPSSTKRRLIPSQDASTKAANQVNNITKQMNKDIQQQQQQATEAFQQFQRVDATNAEIQKLKQQHEKEKQDLELQLQQMQIILNEKDAYLKKLEENSQLQSKKREREVNEKENQIIALELKISAYETFIKQQQQQIKEAKEKTEEWVKKGSEQIANEMNQKNRQLVEYQQKEQSQLRNEQLQQEALQNQIQLLFTWLTQTLSSLELDLKMQKQKKSAQSIRLLLDKIKSMQPQQLATNSEFITQQMQNYLEQFQTLLKQ